MRATCRLTAALLFALFALAGCDDDKQVTAEPQVWRSAAASLESAVLSASGTAPDDLWVVGADAGAGGMVARFNGTAWERLNSGQRYDLWWVQALDASNRPRVGRKLLPPPPDPRSGGRHGLRPLGLGAR